MYFRQLGAVAVVVTVGVVSQAQAQRETQVQREAQAGELATIAAMDPTDLRCLTAVEMLARKGPLEDVV